MVRSRNPNAKVTVDLAAGRKTRFRLANGSVCSAHSCVTLETPFGWCSLFCLATEQASPVLFSVKSLRALNSAIDFSTDTIAMKGQDCEGKAFTVEKKLEVNSRGHLLLDLSNRE